MYRLSYCLILSLWLASVPMNAGAQDMDDGHKILHPQVSKMASTSLGNDFKSFRNGPMFSPLDLLIAYYLLGYASSSDLFADFFASLSGSSSISYDDSSDVEIIEEELCEGQTGEESEGVVKITFDCSGDGLQYSCYADLIDGEYSVPVPSEVFGMTCSISVEAGEISSGDSDLEVDGVESEEVELDEDTSVVIDVTED